MRRHVVWALGVVYPLDIGRREAAQCSDEIGLYVRVGILLDDQDADVCRM
jgi:hypothetical protein